MTSVGALVSKTISAEPVIFRFDALVAVTVTASPGERHGRCVDTG